MDEAFLAVFERAWVAYRSTYSLLGTMCGGREPLADTEDKLGVRSSRMLISSAFGPLPHPSYYLLCVETIGHEKETIVFLLPLKGVEGAQWRHR